MIQTKDKVEYTHLSAWIDALEVTAIQKQAIKQQIISRDIEIAELQEKLRRSEEHIDLLQKEAIQASDKLHRRNLQIADLKAKLVVALESHGFNYPDHKRLNDIRKIVKQ